MSNDYMNLLEANVRLQFLINASDNSAEVTGRLRGASNNIENAVTSWGYPLDKFRRDTESEYKKQLNKKNRG